MEIVLENIETVSVEAIQEKIAEIEGWAPDCVFLNKNGIHDHREPGALAEELIITIQPNILKEKRIFYTYWEPK